MILLQMLLGAAVLLVFWLACYGIGWLYRSWYGGPRDRVAIDGFLLVLMVSLVVLSCLLVGRLGWFVATGAIQ
jgi:hypothetical protein